MRYQTTEIAVQVGESFWELTCLESFERSVDALHSQLEAEGRAKELESLCPYFGVLWPGGRALARLLVEREPHTLAGARVLELGCGLALPSFVAAALGAQVVATDAHPHAEWLFAQNAARTPQRAPLFQRLDWTSGDAPEGRFERIIASDVLYEQLPADRLAPFLREALAPGGEAWILDPNRPYWERAVRGAKELGFTVMVEPWDRRANLEEPKEGLLLRIGGAAA